VVKIKLEKIKVIRVTKVKAKAVKGHEDREKDITLFLFLQNKTSLLKIRALFMKRKRKNIIPAILSKACEIS
jgi:hypothetical protein